MIKKRPNEYTPDELDFVRCSSEEQDTSITRGRNDEEWSLYTNDNTILTKMKKMMREHPDCYRLVNVYWNTDGSPAGYEFALSKKAISFRGKMTKNLSEEQRKASAERLKKCRDKRWGNSQDTDKDEE